MKQILIGDCIASMKTLPDCSVHTCVTSPPYFGLRDYGMDGQIGLEDTPEAFVARLVEVFREVRRVLRDDGTLWLNLGDSYAANRAYQVPSTKGGLKHGPGQSAGGKGSAVPSGLKPKDLIGIPWRVAFALQADGWYLRQDIIWSKPNPMPESVTDRCTKAHEYIFLLSKGPRYYFDSEAIKEPLAESSLGRLKQNVEAQIGITRANGGAKTNGNFKAAGNLETGVRNRRTVWTVTTKPFKGAHFATFPPDLIEPCVLAGAPERCCAGCGAPFVRLVEKGEPDLYHQRACGGDAEGKYTGVSTKDYSSAKAQDASATKARILAGMTKRTTVGWQPTCTCDAEAIGGTVLDPFGGSGTTAGVAMKHGRNAILCELNPDYVGMMEARISAIAGVQVNPLHVWVVAA